MRRKSVIFKRDVQNRNKSRILLQITHLPVVPAVAAAYVFFPGFQQVYTNFML